MSPNAGGWQGCGVSANEYSCAHGAQINFGDLTPYLTYDGKEGCVVLECNSVCLHYGKQLSHPLQYDVQRRHFINSISILCTYSNNLPLYREDSSPAASCQACQEYYPRENTCFFYIKIFTFKGKVSRGWSWISLRCMLNSIQRFDSLYFISAACNLPPISLRLLYLFNFQ